MKKTWLIVLAVLIGLIPSWLPAAETLPDSVIVNFSVDKSYYAYSSPPTPVMATISITNDDPNDFWVNSNFLFNSDLTTPRNYYLSIKIIDPSGRSLPVKQTATLPGRHKMQPLGFITIMVDGKEKAIEVAPCMQMPDDSITPAPVNLREYYDLSIPGRYLAQVQLSMMAFDSEICDIRNYRWQGLLESQVISFYIEGDTAVTVSPAVWPLTWKEAAAVPGAVTATLTLPGVPVNQLETKAIYLNDVYSGNAVVSGNSLVVTFDGRQAIDSIGAIERGKAYKVRVAGWYKGGGYFGGMAQIEVLEYHFQGFFSPVDNLPIVNSAKAGQTIPVKWRLTDAAGQPVSDPASFVNVTTSNLNCDSLAGESESAIETYAGSSGLQNLGDGYWQYNWKTSASFANSCRTLVLKLKDGSTYQANFKFKK